MIAQDLYGLPTGLYTNKFRANGALALRSTCWNCICLFVFLLPHKNISLTHFRWRSFKNNFTVFVWLCQLPHAHHCIQCERSTIHFIMAADQVVAVTWWCVALFYYYPLLSRSQDMIWIHCPSTTNSATQRASSGNYSSDIILRNKPWPCGRKKNPYICVYINNIRSFIFIFNSIRS